MHAPAPTPSDGDQYLRAVRDVVVHVRQSGVFLSPVDQQIIDAWCEAGVPLAAVLRGIRLGAERLSRLKRPPRGLPLKRLVKDVAKEQTLAAKAQEGRADEAARAGREGGAASAFLEAARARLVAARMRPDDPDDVGIIEEISALGYEAGEAGWSAELCFAALAGCARRWYEGVRLALPADERQRREAAALAALGEQAARQPRDVLRGTVAARVRRDLCDEDGVLDPDGLWAALEQDG